MSDLSAEIRLRPTRIGFLVPPTDLAAVTAVMRACASLWGGCYNPIIPVFKRAPPEWKPEIYRRFTGYEVARGYVRFFEPDVYVEAESGLLEKAGLGRLREKHRFREQVVLLKDFLKAEQGRDWAEPAFGLNVHEVLGHVYKTEQQFVRRDKRKSLLVSEERGSGATGAIFGSYPTSKTTRYLERGYSDVFQPSRVKPSLDSWRDVFLRGAVTPLRVTAHGLDQQRYWHHDPLIYVFDPTRATDLIDLWNLRCEPHPVLPVPLDWFEGLADDIYKILKKEHRPVVGNPHGVMHNATIEFGRSIPNGTAEGLIRSLKPGLPKGALSVKYWRNAIWVEHRDDFVHRDSRLRVTAKEQRTTLSVKDDGDLRATFEVLEPPFAERYSRTTYRWVNVLNVSNYEHRNIATVLPFNTFDRTWPRLGMGGDSIPVGSEGWVFGQQYTNLGQSVSLLSDQDAIVGSLNQLGVTAKLSEPGHIAKQMLEQLGGLWGAYLVADIQTLQLLNKMAGGLKRRSNDKETVEESYPLRTATLKDWLDLIAARKARHSLPKLSLADFTSRNVVRLGLETRCPHCAATNWSTLTQVDYRVTCERCLKQYDFPQAGLASHNRNFTYRVAGPFSVPDYGLGSYSALLTLRLLDRFNSSMSDMTHSTAMQLAFDGKTYEVDFVAWQGDERLGREHRRPPRLVIGETKSLGQGELITRKCLSKLKAVASKVPDAVVVISVLRNHFTSKEKRLLKPFVNWGRRINIHGEPTNPVVLLTENELTMDYLLSKTWQDLGGVHARFAEYEHTKHLLGLADATQQIYLDLPSFHKARKEYWDKRLARRKKVQEDAD